MHTQYAASMHVSGRAYDLCVVIVVDIKGHVDHMYTPSTTQTQSRSLTGFASVITIATPKTRKNRTNTTQDAPDVHPAASWAHISKSVEHLVELLGIAIAILTVNHIPL
jgi:hypothetical protein